MAVFSDTSLILIFVEVGAGEEGWLVADFWKSCKFILLPVVGAGVVDGAGAPASGVEGWVGAPVIGVEGWAGAPVIGVEGWAGDPVGGWVTPADFWNSCKFIYLSYKLSGRQS